MSLYKDIVVYKVGDGETGERWERMEENGSKEEGLLVWQVIECNSRPRTQPNSSERRDSLIF